MAQRIFFACLLVFLTGGAGTAARAADCSPLELLQFYSIAAASNFSAIDGGDKGPGVLAMDSRAHAVKPGMMCPNKVFFEDVPATGQYRAYRIVEFDATSVDGAVDTETRVLDQFSPLLANQNFSDKPYGKQDHDGYYTFTWDNPDNRWVVIRFFRNNLSENGGTLFSIKVGRYY